MHINNNLCKTVILIFSLVVSCSSDDNGAVDDKYLVIPDAHFESLLISQGIDTEGVINQRLLKHDAKGVSALDLNFSGDGEISDLTHLFISSNLLVNLNVSDLQKLVHLMVHGNPNLSCIKILSGQSIQIVTKMENQVLSSICD